MTRISPDDIMQLNSVLARVDKQTGALDKDALALLDEETSRQERMLEQSKTFSDDLAAVHAAIAAAREDVQHINIMLNTLAQSMKTAVKQEELSRFRTEVDSFDPETLLTQKELRELLADFEENYT
ncbi:MAG: hypothetical protein V1725_00375 [archaeon]